MKTHGLLRLGVKIYLAALATAVGAAGISSTNAPFAAEPERLGAVSFLTSCAPERKPSPPPQRPRSHTMNPCRT